MKQIKIGLYILFVFMTLVILFFITSCMNEEDYYTKEYVDSLVAELETALSTQAEESDAAVEALKSEYLQKIEVLEAEDAKNKAAIERLSVDYNNKVAELEKVAADNDAALTALKAEYEAKVEALNAEDAKNKAAIERLSVDYNNKVAELEKVAADNDAALTALKAEYEAKVEVLNTLISANVTSISTLETELEDKITELKATYDGKITSIAALITALQEADSDNIKRIATLEAQMAALLSEHVHTFGERVDCSGNENLSCEKRLSYRICASCGVLEWKSGTYQNHSFNTTTILPTCTSEGYDEKICRICGTREIINKTEKTKHPYATTYLFDSAYHWIPCTACDATSNYEEHTANDDGACTVCKEPLTPTEGLVYLLSADNSYAEVIDYTGTATKIMIAESYQGVPVKVIGGDAFYGKSISSIRIPATITKIDSLALNFKDLQIYITDIAKWCEIHFGGDFTHYDYDLYLNNQKVTNLILPEGVKEISGWAFYHCKSLESISIPATVMHIYGSAFSQCSNLTSVTIASNITEIHEATFSDCRKLTTVNIPETVARIGSRAFYNCSQLSNISIPASVTKVGFGAFDGCIKLIEVIDGISYVDTWVIGSASFSVSVALRNGTVGVADSAFSGATRLRTITIPDSVMFFGAYAFGGRSCSVYISNITKWCQITFADNESNPLGYEGSLYLNGDLVKDLIIPDEVIKINNYAFYNYSALESVTLSSNTTYIGYEAFYNCSRLENLIIPQSVEFIDTRAFRYCRGLTEVNIGSGVKNIGSGAFEGCDSLRSITIPFIGEGGDSYWRSKHFGYIFGASSYEENSEYVPHELRTVIITGGSEIGEYAFYGCSGLYYITLSDSIARIEKNAFTGCENICYEYYDGAYYLGTANNPYHMLVKSQNSLISSCNIHENTKIIMSYAFEYCTQLSQITIPKNVVYIGEYAFAGCANLASATFEEPNGWDIRNENSSVGTSLNNYYWAAMCLTRDYCDYHFMRV